MSYKWYFVRCQSGCEKRIRDSALHRLKVANVADLVPQVLVPYELVTDMKGGKKRTVEKKLYPGYLMVQADLDEPEDVRVLKARTTLRGIDGLRDFLGSRGEPHSVEAYPRPGSLPRRRHTRSKHILLRGRGLSPNGCSPKRRAVIA